MRQNYWKKSGKILNGYEGLYQVSNFGRVKSLSNEKTRKEKILNITHRNKYNLVTLYKNHTRTTFSVHRLVAQAFIPNPDNLPQVNHKDENKLNNKVDNLEWCTQIYNVNYSHAKSVQCIETGIVYKSLTEAGKINNIQLGLLCRVCNKNNYTAGGYHWKNI